MSTVLLVDDDSNLRLALRKALTRKGAHVFEAQDGQEAVVPLHTGYIEGKKIDVCVLDLRMPRMSGLDVLRKTLQRKVPVIVLTGHGSIPDAVEAMRLGASNFMQKPVDADELWPVLEQTMVLGVQDNNNTDIISESDLMTRFLGALERAAASDEPILLLGETGTGKELAARRVHQTSARSNNPFVAFNAACVPRELFESELFGHKKGAFTGAVSDREGLMAQAKDGTLFLDEIGDLPLEAQVKLLRALEEKRFRPVGSDKDRPFNARVVSATHQHLNEMVEQKTFRADLFYRLGVVPLTLPPLRERQNDMLLIARAWVNRLSTPTRSLLLSQNAEQVLSEHPFPGNVRELINVIKRAAIFSESNTIEGEQMRVLLRENPFHLAKGSEAASQDRDPQRPAAGDRVTLETLEREHISRLLDEVKNVSEVARIVGIDRRTLQRKMIAWGLRNE